MSPSEDDGMRHGGLVESPEERHHRKVHESMIATQKSLVAKVAEMHKRNTELREALERYQAIFFGRLGNLEHMGTDEFRQAHARVFIHASDVLNGVYPYKQTHWEAMDISKARADGKSHVR